MRYFKKIISAILVLSLVLAQMSIFAFAAGSNPTISAESAIIYGDSGEVFFEKNADLCEFFVAFFKKARSCSRLRRSPRMSEPMQADIPTDAPPYPSPLRISDQRPSPPLHSSIDPR